MCGERRPGHQGPAAMTTRRTVVLGLLATTTSLSTAHASD
jgi:hypothetical protein